MRVFTEISVERTYIIVSAHRGDRGDRFIGIAEHEA